MPRDTSVERPILSGGRRKLPPLNALRAFEAAARHCNFTRAAEELCVTQAAVSHQVKLLEEYLGVPLFVRQANGLVTTARGEAYFNSISQALDLMFDATQQTSLESDKASLMIDCHPHFARSWLVPRLPRLHEACPELTVNLRVRPATESCDFAREKIDVAIRYGTSWLGVISNHLFTPILFPVCSPALVARHGGTLTMANLIEETFMIVASESDDWRRWFAGMGVLPSPRRNCVIFDSYALALEAAIEGQGVAIGRLPLVIDEMDAGRLVVPFSAAVEGVKAWHLIYANSAAFLGRVQRFKNWLMAEAKKSAEEIAARKSQFRMMPSA